MSNFSPSVELRSRQIGGRPLDFPPKYTHELFPLHVERRLSHSISLIVLAFLFILILLDTYSSLSASRVNFPQLRLTKPGTALRVQIGVRIYLHFSRSLLLHIFTLSDGPLPQTHADFDSPSPSTWRPEARLGVSLPEKDTAGTRSSLKLRYAMKEKRYSFLMVPSLTFGTHGILRDLDALLFCCLYPLRCVEIFD
jgi:hypothetical protein